MPLVNVITVAYNARDDLEKTIRSVVGQTYPSINYIVIDGGSEDGTVEMIEKYEDKIGYFISEKDKGIYDAMNKGMSHVSKGYINFLNAGDEYISKNTIDDIFKGIGDSYDLIYGKIIVGPIASDASNKPQDTWDFTVDNLLAQNTAVLCHQAMFISKDAAPLYDASYKIKGDLDWYFKILYKKPQLTYCKSDVIVTSYKGGGLSEKKYLLDVYETARVIIKRFGFSSFIKHKYHRLIGERIFKEIGLSSLMQKK